MRRTPLSLGLLVDGTGWSFETQRSYCLRACQRSLDAQALRRHVRFVPRPREAMIKRRPSGHLRPAAASGRRRSPSKLRRLCARSCFCGRSSPLRRRQLSKPSVDEYRQFRDRQVQPPRDPPQHADRRLLGPSFEGSDVGAVDFDPPSEVLLRELQFEPAQLDRDRESADQEVVSAGSHPHRICS